MRHKRGEADTAAAPFTWVRCPSCGTGLWKRFDDHLEMTLSLRGGQRRTISAPLDSVFGLKVVCEKCQAIWTGSGEHTDAV